MDLLTSIYLCIYLSIVVLMLMVVGVDPYLFNSDRNIVDLHVLLNGLTGTRYHQ